MKVLLQKVSRASVSIEGSIVGAISEGYLLFLGVVQGDTEEYAVQLANKITKLRLFASVDAQGVAKINDHSLLERGGEVLVVSQFTLAGRIEKGNRPDYTMAAEAQEAEKLYLFFIDQLKKLGVSKVETGRFGAMMDIELINNGPVTLCIERPIPVS